MEQVESMSVSLIAPVYKRLNCLHIIINCMLCQSDPNWELILVCDGSDERADEIIYRYVADYSDHIKYFHIPHRGQWGHYARNFGLGKATKEFVVFSGHDNYYVPSFIAEINRIKHELDFIYWDMVHSYFLFKKLETELSLGRIDMGAFATRRELVMDAGGLNPNDVAADWLLVDKLLQENKDIRIGKINRVLFVHN